MPLTSDQRLFVAAYARKDTYAERQFDREQDEERARRSFPKLRSGFSVMYPNINRCAVFHQSKPAGAATTIDVEFPVASYNSEDKTLGSVRYIGAWLTQAHKRVLLGLVELVAGKEGDQWVEFHACTFLESIGKEADSRAVDSLVRQLTDLRSATFCVRQYECDRGTIFGWLNQVEFKGRNFRVQVSGNAALEFSGLGRTYLPTAKRRQLRDGLQTWLFDFIFSSEQQRFSYDALARLLERRPGADFGKEVRAALKRLAAVGAIERPEFSRGRFSARKRLM